MTPSFWHNRIFYMHGSKCWLHQKFIPSLKTSRSADSFKLRAGPPTTYKIPNNTGMLSFCVFPLSQNLCGTQLWYLHCMVWSTWYRIAVCCAKDAMAYYALLLMLGRNSTAHIFWRPIWLRWYSIAKYVTHRSWSIYYACNALLNISVEAACLCSNSSIKHKPSQYFWWQWNSMVVFFHSLCLQHAELSVAVITL